MTATTTTRTRATGDTRRGTAQTRRASATRPAYGSYVSGANALTIGYADPVELDEPLDVADQYGEPQPGVVDERDATFADLLGEPAPLPVALPRASLIVLVLALVVAAVLGVLLLNTKINENSFTLDKLRAEQAALDVTEQQLNQQLADRESTGNLNAQAGRLGLVPAGTPAFLRPDGKVVGDPQPATDRGAGTAAATSSDPGR